MDSGGCVLVLMTEGGEQKQNTNINFLLEEYGIMVNNGKLNEEEHIVHVIMWCG